MSSSAGNSGSSEKHYIRIIGPDGLYKSEAFFHSLVQTNGGGEEIQFESGSGKDEERDNSDTSNAEDFEVRMDHTDDLLHMGFSFLDHINLCRATIACSQCRAASAHEDFWRCLNFENRNISVEQFEDICWRYPNATELNISGTPAIPMLVMTTITSLRFADPNLRTLMLSSIMVSNCPVLHRISITSNALQKLSLQKQESLAALTLHCPNLQEVDLTDCESLTNSICDVFTDGGGCPMLKSLILENCKSLTAVRFSSTSLASLSLVGCRGITSLELICPYLEQVSLDSCDHLESAAFFPVGLKSLNLGICPKLNALSIDAPNMVLLELKGWGVLTEVSINCPLLTSLDASFCSQLKDDCLSATAASCPLIESLILMSCPSVGSEGLYSLRWLPNLIVLDLSYTFLTSLKF